MTAETFVQRIFTVDGEEVVCRFFHPEADGGDFCCRYEVAWQDGLHSRNVYGADGVQALLLAMKTAHSDLLVARERGKRQVNWQDRAWLGLPVSDATGDWEVDDVAWRAAAGRSA